MNSQARIIDRGRGPEIEGTRITVYAILDYLKHGWHHDYIAALLRLSSDQVRAAAKYIEDHREEVMANYERILERHRTYEYSPEVKEKLRKNREEFQKRVAEIRARRAAEVAHASDHAG